MRSPTLRQFRTFLAVVDTGSVSLAAQALGLTQPAASQQLRELERGLSVRLLDRAGGKIIPTAAGLALLEPARRAQAAAADALAAATQYRQGDTGSVRLGTGATACIFFLPKVLAAVKRVMPGLTVAVSIGNTNDVLPRIEAGALDIGIVTLPKAVSRTLRTTWLLSDPLVALLPEDQAGGRSTITAGELNALPLILYESGGHTRTLTNSWFQQDGITPRPIMELGSVEAIKVLVAASLGAAVLPRLALPTALAGTISLGLQPSMSRDLAYVMRAEKIMDRGLRLLIGELERVAQSPNDSAS